MHCVDGFELKRSILFDLEQMSSDTYSPVFVTDIYGAKIFVGSRVKGRTRVDMIPTYVTGEVTHIFPADSDSEDCITSTSKTNDVIRICGDNSRIYLIFKRLGGLICLD